MEKVESKKQQTIEALKKTEELYVIISACTKMPYVVCDVETFDDEIFVYFSQEQAKVEGKKLLEEKIPVQIAKIEEKQKLGFFSSLCTMGINCILVDGHLETESRIQLEELVKRPQLDKIPEGQVWIENPQLYLTSLYFMQELRKQPKPQLTEELKELQEEILVNYGRGRFIAAIHNENGIPLIKKEGQDAFQPLFTDVLEFQKFNVNGKFRPMIVDANKVVQILVPDARGVVINPNSINLQLPITREKEKNHEKSVEQIAAEAIGKGEA